MPGGETPATTPAINASPITPLDFAFLLARRWATTMKSGFPYKPVTLLFLIVLGIYLAVFYGFEMVRHRKGPWEVDFRTNAQGSALIRVSQPRLGLKDVQITFHGEDARNASGRVAFDRVRTPVPFGKVIYEDLTFLPGVVTFDLFGHEVEILPRALIVNKEQIPWRSGAEIDLWPTNKLAEPPRPPKKGAR
jgi:hypothetical protein